MKIDHIGFAVKSFEESSPFFNLFLNQKPYKEEFVESEGVKTSFYQVGESKIELLEATNPNSPISKYLENRGKGMHHIAFEVDDIIAEMKRLKDSGIRLLSENPKKGADNKLICFLHPKDTEGVLIEICQAIV